MHLWKIGITLSLKWKREFVFDMEVDTNSLPAIIIITKIKKVKNERIKLNSLKLKNLI